MLNQIRTVFHVSGQTVRQWRKNYRILVVFALEIMLAADFIRPLYLAGSRYGYAVTPWVFPFIDSQPFMKVLIYLGLIFMLGDAPFVRRNQIFVLTRCGRPAYLAGQVLAAARLTAVYFLVLAVIPVAVYAGDTAWSPEWGDILFSAAKTDLVMAESGVGKIIVSSSIIDHLSPVQAWILSYLFHVLTGIMLGCVVLLGNIAMPGVKWGGIFCALALIILDPLLSDFLYRWSPASWGDLSRMDFVRNGARMSVGEAAVRLTVFTALICVICLKIAPKKEVRVLEE